MGSGRRAEVPIFIFCSLKSKEKGRPLAGRVYSSAANLCAAIKCHILLPQLHMPRQKKQQEDVFNIYSQVSFFNFL